MTGVIFSFNFSSLIDYRLSTKLREGNVFSRVGVSFCSQVKVSM